MTGVQFMRDAHQAGRPALRFKVLGRPELRYFDTGNVGARPVVIVGRTGGERPHDGLARRLSPRYRSLVVDLGLPGPDGVTCAEEVRDIVLFVEHVAGRPVVIAVADAAAGALATQVAALRPDLVQAVVPADECADARRLSAVLDGSAGWSRAGMRVGPAA